MDVSALFLAEGVTQGSNGLNAHNAGFVVLDVPELPAAISITFGGIVHAEPGEAPEILSMDAWLADDTRQPLEETSRAIIGAWPASHGPAGAARVARFSDSIPVTVTREGRFWLCLDVHGAASDTRAVPFDVRLVPLTR